MSNNRRKRHGHPLLVPPKHVIKDGKRILIDNDHGTVVEGRMYSFHFTKGWRNRHGRDMGFNLTQYFVQHVRRK